MGILDLFKRHRGVDAMSYAKMTEPKAKEENFDVQTENDVQRIRLIYVEIEKFAQYGTRDCKIGETLQVSCPYILPKGMTIEDACKVLSYLSEEVERKYNLEPASQRSVDKVSYILWEYGFVWQNGFPYGISHSVAYDEPYKSNRKFAQGIDGIVDLFTVGGDVKLFKKSDLNDRYFEWFTKGVTKQEVQQIYDKIGLSLPNSQSQNDTFNR